MKINLILQINDRDQQYKICKHKNINRIFTDKRFSTHIYLYINQIVLEIINMKTWILMSLPRNYQHEDLEINVTV